jgi:hypothetical protein
MFYPPLSFDGLLYGDGKSVTPLLLFSGLRRVGVRESGRVVEWSACACGWGAVGGGGEWVSCGAVLMREFRLRVGAGTNYLAAVRMYHLPWENPTTLVVECTVCAEKDTHIWKNSWKQVSIRYKIGNAGNT